MRVRISLTIDLSLVNEGDPTMLRGRLTVIWRYMFIIGKKLDMCMRAPIVLVKSFLIICIRGLFLLEVFQT